MAKYKRYKKDCGYSYTLGIFLTIELITHQSEKVLEVILSTDTENSTGIDKIILLCEKRGIPYSYSDKLINSLSPKGNCYAMGIFSTYNDPIDPNDHHVLLVNPSDAGNLGTIIRTALGFDVKNLAIIKPGVDIFDPKAIRASMGSLFSINFTYYDSFADYIAMHPKHHLYPFMLQAQYKLKDVIPESPFTLIFGNEGSGLDTSFLNVGTSVIIPHAKTIDSLNLSVAASIALYEFTKTKF